MAPMSGLIDVDVTTANRLLASHDPPPSLTAFVVASVEAAAPPILVPSSTRTGRARAAIAWVTGRRRSLRPGGRLIGGAIGRGQVELMPLPGSVPQLHRCSQRTSVLIIGRLAPNPKEGVTMPSCGPR